MTTRTRLHKPTARRLRNIARYCTTLLLAVSATAALSLPVAAAEPTFQPDGIPPGQFSTDSVHPEKKREYFLAIFGGSTQGVYYYVASAICEAMRARYEEHHIRCVPLRSQGAGSNRNLMNQGRAQMAIVQSDTNYFAATGENPMPAARSVVSLHNELGVLVATGKSGINSPMDLRNHRVNIAARDSVAHALWTEYLEALDIKEQDFSEVLTFPQDVNYQGLCGNYIDAFGLWSGHPVPALVDTLERCDARVLGMWHPDVAKLLAKREYYFRGTLPAGTYPGQDQPLDSYGIKASLIAHEQTLPYIVYWVTRVLIENVDFLRTRHPALANLDADEMFQLGNFLPPHAGAANYWRESGRMRGADATVASPADSPATPPAR